MKDPLRILSRVRVCLCEYRDQVLEVSCLADADGNPDRTTMDPIDRPLIEEIDAIVAEIDDALNEGTEQ